MNIKKEKAGVTASIKQSNNSEEKDEMLIFTNIVIVYRMWGGLTICVLYQAIIHSK